MRIRNLLISTAFAVTVVTAHPVHPATHPGAPGSGLAPVLVQQGDPDDLGQDRTAVTGSWLVRLIEGALVWISTGDVL